MPQSIKTFSQKPFSYKYFKDRDFSKYINFLGICQKFRLNLGYRLHHSENLWHQSKYYFLQGYRQKRAHFSVEKTYKKFIEALYLCVSIGLRGGSIYIVFEKKEQKKILCVRPLGPHPVKTFQKDSKNTINDNLYFSKKKKDKNFIPIAWNKDKWTSGTFTNYQSVKKRISLYGTLWRQFLYFIEKNKQQQNAGFNRFFGNFYATFNPSISSFKISYKKIPDCVIVENAEKNLSVLEEAVSLGIPSIGFYEKNSKALNNSISIQTNNCRVLLKILLFTCLYIRKPFFFKT